jgi:hypothetical protein
MSIWTFLFIFILFPNVLSRKIFNDFKNGYVFGWKDVKVLETYCSNFSSTCTYTGDQSQSTEINYENNKGQWLQICKRELWFLSIALLNGIYPSMKLQLSWYFETFWASFRPKINNNKSRVLRRRHVGIKLLLARVSRLAKEYLELD